MQLGLKDDRAKSYKIINKDKRNTKNRNIDKECQKLLTLTRAADSRLSVFC